MEWGRIVFLAGAFATHAVVGYALVRGFTDADPRVGLVLGIAPDADFLFPAAWGWPLVHRGITHTPLFALAIVAGAYAIARDRTLGLAAGVGLGSHLAIDSLSPTGIDWFYPLEASASPGLPVHGPIATALLWTVAIATLAWRTDALPSISAVSPIR